MVARAIVLLAIAAVVFFGRRELQRREVARLWGRLSACLIGKPLAEDEPPRRRFLGIRRAILRHTPRNQEPDWPSRCEEHQRALVSSGAVRALAPALATAAEALSLGWDREDQLRLDGLDAVFAASAAVRASVADDVVRPPPPVVPVAELASLADTPRGVRVTLERADPREPRVRIGRDATSSCGFDPDWRTARCASGDPSLVPAPSAAGAGPNSRVLGTWRYPDGTAVVVREETVSFEDELIMLERVAPDGQVTRTPFPYPTASGRVAVFGGWLLSVDRARTAYVVNMRRLPSATAWLGPAIEVSAGSARPEPFGSCQRAKGQVVVLASRGEPAYGSNDPVVALFETNGKWVTASGAVARAFSDPDPVYHRASLTCDDGGAWLSWTDSTGHMFVVRCTPEGCKRLAPWPVPGVSPSNSRVVELGGRVVLLATTTRPWGIVMRSGDAERIPALEETCLVEDASLVDVAVHDDRALIVGRSEAGQLGALRLDASGNVTAITPAPPR